MKILLLENTEFYYFPRFRIIYHAECKYFYSIELFNKELRIFKKGV